MKNRFRGLAVAVVALVAAGCAHDPYGHHHSFYDGTRESAQDVLVINVTGYGAPKSTFENLAQRRLMALRASEIDAYRKMAEQVSGIRIIGETRVDDYIAGRDVLRARINTLVQGAAITNQEFQSDGLAVTTMSLKVSKAMLRHMLEHEVQQDRTSDGLVTGTAYRDNGFYSN